MKKRIASFFKFISLIFVLQYSLVFSAEPVSGGRVNQKLISFIAKENSSRDNSLKTFDPNPRIPASEISDSLKKKMIVPKK